MIADLKGKAVLITGASTGIGAAAARAFARHGSHVAVHYNASKEAALEVAGEVKAAGARAVVVGGDVTVEADVKRIVAETLAAFGRIDVLVNNAGINPRQGRPEDIPLGTWEHVITTNLTSYFLHAQAAAKRMIAAGAGGSIVMVSSIAGATALGRGNLAFGVSKAGVDQMVRELATEWGIHSIRVNSILPCQFLNDGLKAYITDPVNKPIADRMIGGIPMGRMGRAEEIVGPVLFLASPAASMVTGVNLPVDGGNLALNAGGTLPTLA